MRRGGVGGREWATTAAVHSASRIRVRAEERRLCISAAFDERISVGLHSGLRTRRRPMISSLLCASMLQGATAYLAGSMRGVHHVAGALRALSIA